MDININNKAYSFPSRLSMDQWCHIIDNFDLDDSAQHPHVIHYLTGAPVDMLELADVETLALAMAFVVQMLNLRVPTNLKNFEDLTFGEFIDLDIYLNTGITKHYKEILDILEMKKEGSEFGMYAIETYNKYRTYIYRQYKKLFEIEDSEFDEPTESTVDPLALARNWYHIIVSLANSDLLKIDEVTEQPLKKALNFMAYQKEKQIEENLKRLKQQREYDLSRRSK